MFYLYKTTKHISVKFLLGQSKLSVMTM